MVAINGSQGVSLTASSQVPESSSFSATTAPSKSGSSAIEKTDSLKAVPQEQSLSKTSESKGTGKAESPIDGLKKEAKKLNKLFSLLRNEPNKAIALINKSGKASSPEGKDAIAFLNSYAKLVDVIKNPGTYLEETPLAPPERGPGDSDAVFNAKMRIHQKKVDSRQGGSSQSIKDYQVKPEFKDNQAVTQAVNEIKTLLTSGSRRDETVNVGDIIRDSGELFSLDLKTNAQHTENAQNYANVIEGSSVAPADGHEFGADKGEVEARLGAMSNNGIRENVHQTTGKAAYKGVATSQILSDGHRANIFNLGATHMGSAFTSDSKAVVMQFGGSEPISISEISSK